jgi:hypothetical protein
MPPPLEQEIVPGSAEDYQNQLELEMARMSDLQYVDFAGSPGLLIEAQQVVERMRHQLLMIATAIAMDAPMICSKTAVDGVEKAESPPIEPEVICLLEERKRRRSAVAVPVLD